MYPCSLLARALVCLLVISVPSVVLAQFVMDFTPDTGLSMSTTVLHESFSTQRTTSGQTPFLTDGYLPETVTDGNGNTYAHLIVGSVADGFIQEVYILKSASFGTNWNGAGWTANSASLGSGNTCCQVSGLSTGGNGGNPFGILDAPIAAGGANTGNGSAYPTKVIVRQLLNTNEITQEFIKDSFNLKPRINQILVTPDIVAFFDMDMGNSTYDESNIAATVFNFQQLSAGAVPDNAGDFMMTSDGTTTDITAGGRATNDQRDRITGGRYIYDTSTGSARGGGNYVYVDGVVFDQTDLDWSGYFDTTEDNPWSIDFNKPVE